MIVSLFPFIFINSSEKKPYSRRRSKLINFNFSFLIEPLYFFPNYLLMNRTNKKKGGEKKVRLVYTISFFFFFFLWEIKGRLIKRASWIISASDTSKEFPKPVRVVFISLLFFFRFPFFFLSFRRKGILNKRKRHVEDKILRGKKHIGKHQEGPKVEDVTRLEKLEKKNKWHFLSCLPRF